MDQVGLHNFFSIFSFWLFLPWRIIVRFFGLPFRSASHPPLPHQKPHLPDTNCNPSPFDLHHPPLTASDEKEPQVSVIELSAREEEEEPVMKNAEVTKNLEEPKEEKKEEEIPEGCGVIQKDPWLAPFKDEIKRRYDYTKTWIKQIEETEGGLEKFSKVCGRQVLLQSVSTY